MALVTQPADGLWTAQLKNNARQGRSLLAAFFENVDAVPGNGTKSGVIVTTGTATAADLQAGNVAGLNIDVSPGSGVAHLAGQGPMLGFMNAVKTVRCSDPPASNPRNDIVIMRMYNLAGSDTSPDGQPCRIEVITGTPNAVPVDPVTPNTNGTITGIPAQAGLGTGGIGIPIARAQVSTGGVITLTDIRKSSGVVGGPRYVLPGDAGDNSGRAGQMRYNPTSGLLEVKDSTGTWQPVRYGAYVGGEWRATAAQSLATGANKLQFGTNVVLPSGITYNGVDTFTCVTSKPYGLWAQLRSSVAVSGGIAFGATTYADATHILPFSSFSGGPDYGNGGTIWINAGTQFCAWFYNNGSATNTNFALRPAHVKIWAAP